MRHAGLLASKRGAGGGYTLLRAPGEITLREVLRILDGPVAPVPCAAEQPTERCTCPDEEVCELRLIMLKVRNAIADVLDNISLADVVQNAIDQTVRAVDVFD